MAKHRAGSENAGGSPQEVGVFVERCTVVVFLQPEGCTSVYIKMSLH